MTIPDRNDPQFLELITKGIPLERLERRLRPRLKLGDYDHAFEKMNLIDLAIILKKVF